MRPQRVHAFRNDDALGRHDAVALAQLVAAGEVHPDELTAAAIARAEAVEAHLDAVAYSAYDAPRTSAA